MILFSLEALKTLSFVLQQVSIVYFYYKLVKSYIGIKAKYGALCSSIYIYIFFKKRKNELGFFVSGFWCKFFFVSFLV